ncbi:MAG: phage tail protein [Zoogloeaceae bacterium]|jgi:hypothetical protein|nr:phage tail protein [Zoogloeaceae bacterium]
MDALRIDLEDAEFKRMIAHLSAPALTKATRRATRKTAAWVRTHLARKAANQAQIPRRIIATRIRLYNQNWRSGGGGTAVKVWFGLNPVFADTIGKATQGAGGVKVGSFYFPSAFIPGKNPRFAGKVYQRSTAHRLPIMRSRVEMEGDGRAAYDAIRKSIEPRFVEIMRQEINYELLKAAGNAR